MKIKKSIHTTLLTASVAAALCSCVKESKPDDCPPDTEAVVLYVDFDEKLYPTRSGLKSEVETMYVFVFGHDGYYIRTLVDDTPDVGSDYVIPVPLAPGDYEFIGWTNLHGNYNLLAPDLVVGETTVEDLFIELDISSGDTIRDVGHHLHYGIVREPREVVDNTWHYYMQLDRYTYTVNIVTEGLTPDSDDYQYVIADRNGRYSFYSDEVSDRTIYYVSDCGKDSAGQLSSSLRVLRLLEDHLDSEVRIENLTNGTVLYQDMLIERLLSLRQLGEIVDFSTKYEYTIKLIFSANVLVAITVDGWLVYKTDDYDI